MGDAYAQVRLSDGNILHCRYNGTTDVCYQQLHARMDRVFGEEAQELAECDCGREEGVEIATNYGDGTTWRGFACPYCLAITGLKSPYWGWRDNPETGDEDPPSGYRDGLPDWWMPTPWEQKQTEVKR